MTEFKICVHCSCKVKEQTDKEGITLYICTWKKCHMRGLAQNVYDITRIYSSAEATDEEGEVREQPLPKRPTIPSIEAPALINSVRAYKSHRSTLSRDNDPQVDPVQETRPGRKPRKTDRVA